MLTATSHKKPRLSFAERQAKRAAASLQALHNAVSHDSSMNYAAIIEGFSERGIPVADIRPRENVFTFNAWRALGYTVRKGEHGVKVVTFVEATKTVETGDGTEKKTFRKPHTTTVFHISQTEKLPVTAAQ